MKKRNKKSIIFGLFIFFFITAIPGVFGGNTFRYVEKVSGLQTPRCSCDTAYRYECPYAWETTEPVGNICYDQYKYLFTRKSKKYLVFGGVSKIGDWHSSTQIIVSFGTCKVTLQDAITKGYFKGVTPTDCLSTLPSVYHTADKILITIGDYTMTLQEAADNNVFRDGATHSYTTTLPVGGHYGAEIEVSSVESLQDSINAGKLSSQCTPGETRTKNCDYLDTACRDYHGVTQTCLSSGYWNNPPCDSYTDAAKGTTPCDGTDDKACDGAGSCVGWSGTGHGNFYDCPFDPYDIDKTYHYEKKKLDYDGSLCKAHIYYCLLPDGYIAKHYQPNYVRRSFTKEVHIPGEGWETETVYYWEDNSYWTEWSNKEPISTIYECKDCPFGLYCREYGPLDVLLNYSGVFTDIEFIPSWKIKPSAA